VGLAQAILSEPEILVLDEPTEGLDPNQRVEIRSLITHLGQDRTVLLSTHVMQEVRRTCSRVVIINRGKIVADGEVDELVDAAQGGSRVSVEIEADVTEASAALNALPSVRTVVPSDMAEGTRARLDVRAEGDPRRDIFELAAGRGWPLWELHLERASLEELFRELTISIAPADGEATESSTGTTVPDEEVGE
jgi:ABC-2 type transport system ATP-binding protein